MRQKLSGIAFLIGILWSSALQAQQPKIPVVGFLNSATEAGYAGMAASFRQGLLRLATKPNRTGSSPLVNTTGIVLVAALVGEIDGLLAKMAVTPRLTRSLAKSDSRL